MSVGFNPLGKATKIIETATFLKVTYAYEDLVFVEHNPFIVRFDQEQANLLHLHFNVDCEAEEAARIEKSLKTQAVVEGLNINPAPAYEMYSEGEDEEIKIRFQA